MRRRGFLKLMAQGSVLGVVGCVGEPAPDPRGPDAGRGGMSPPGGPDAGMAAGMPDADLCANAPTVTLYDTYAQALYMDGTLGPLTGIIEVEFILAYEPVTLRFWHGHGGVDHEFTLTPEHYEGLKRGEKVTLWTTVVQGHQHELFIDPTDPRYRVGGAAPVEVPLDPGCA